MEYSKLLDLATDLGYRMAMSGAETFRVEECIIRVLAAYDIEAEAFVIPNCMHISIEPVVGRPLTRMRRIGLHGNHLDSVEQLSNVSRKICAERPAPEIAAQWLDNAVKHTRSYSFLWYLAGNMIGAFGFSMMFGGSLADALLSGICGLLVALINRFMTNLGSNEFFQTIAAAFPMALLGYAFGALIPGIRSDMATIGALMILVPGLLFTNSMRDIIFGDTNSGINRIVQVLLIAVAIALGTGAAFRVASILWSTPISAAPVSHSIWIRCLACFIGCVGFSINFNIHGPGVLLCALGGLLTWVVYLLCLQLGVDEIAAYFWGAFFASAYAEILARIRKYPAFSYLVISIFPLIPGSGVYYAMEYAVKGQMEQFADKGSLTAAIAGVMAVGILLVSTTVRLWNNGKRRKYEKQNAPR